MQHGTAKQKVNMCVCVSDRMKLLLNGRRRSTLLNHVSKWSKITEYCRFVCDSLFSSVGFCLSSANVRWIYHSLFGQIRCNAQQILLPIISLLWPLHIHALYFVIFTGDFACGAVSRCSSKLWALYLDSPLATLLSFFFVRFYAVSFFFVPKTLQKYSKKTGFLGSLIRVIKIISAATAAAAGASKNKIEGDS